MVAPPHTHRPPGCRQRAHPRATGGVQRAATAMRTPSHRALVDPLPESAYRVAAAMVAFAANPLLCRLALREPVSIGALVLLPVRYPVVSLVGGTIAP